MNISIIDDKFEDGEKLNLYIKDYFAEKFAGLPLYINYYQNENDFLKEFQKNSCDIIFIDYYLNHYTGMDIAKEIRKVDSSVIIIFITMSCDFAIDSYKVKASGYLVKPLVYDDFKEILDLLDYKAMRERQFIEIKNSYEHIKVLLKDIIICDVNGHYTQIHMSNNQIKKCRITFLNFMQLLSPYQEFLHCYRGCVINMEQVKQVDEHAFIMNNGDHIPFRRKQKAKILKSYYDFLFDSNRRKYL